MSTNKVLLGTLAVAGGVYYYDQNVQPILPRRQDIRKDLGKVDQKQREYSNKLTGKIDDAKKELKTAPSLSEKIKESELYQNFAADSKEYKEAVNYKLTPQEDKSLLTRGIDAYIDAVNKIGGSRETTNDFSTMSRRTEVKEKPWFGWFRKDENKAQQKLNETKADAEKKKSEWFSWGSDKKDEAKKEAKNLKSDAESKKNEWVSWGSKKQDQASKDIDGLKSDAEGKKNEWFNWGSKKSDEVSKEASDRYGAAKKELENKKASSQSTLDSTKQQFSEKFEEGKSEAVKAYDAAKTRLDDLTQKLAGATEPDKDERLKLARNDLTSAYNNLKSYSKDTVNDINSSVKDSLKR